MDPRCLYHDVSWGVRPDSSKLVESGREFIHPTACDGGWGGIIEIKVANCDHYKCVHREGSLLYLGDRLLSWAWMNVERSVGRHEPVFQPPGKH